MAYPRKPTLGTALDDPMGTSRPAASASPTAAAKPASPALPSYRTEGGFRQTPTPVNPAPRTPIGATPAPTNPSIRTTPGGYRPPMSPRLSAAMPQLGKIGRAGGAMGVIGAGLEAKSVYDAAKTGGIEGARGEALGAAGRLAAMAKGSELGMRVPGPGAAKVAGSIAGGALGYWGGEQLTNAAAEAVPAPVRTALNAASVSGDYGPSNLGITLGPKVGMMLGQGVPLPQVPARIGEEIQQRIGVRRPDASLGPLRTKPQNPAIAMDPNALTQAVAGGALGTLTGTPAGAAPVAGAPGTAGGGADPNRVLGTFNGRPITQAQADQLAGQLPTANGMPAVAGGNYVASTGVRRPTAEGAADLGRVARPVAQVNAPMTDNYYTRQAMEQQRGVLSDIDSQMFALRGNSQRYRSGREAMAQLLATKAGIVNAGLANASGSAGDERNTRANIALQNAQAQNAQTLKDAELEGAQQIARGNNTTQLAAQVLENRRARRPGVITTADGQTGSVDDSGTFRPVVDAIGKPVRVGTERRAEVSPDKLLEVYGAELAAIRQAAGKDDEKLKAGIDALNASPLGRSYAQALGGAASIPAIGAIENNDETGQPMRFLGGNPADPTRWQEIK